jgi:hypothetical protein
MARYEHLPIYRAVVDAVVHFEQVIQTNSTRERLSQLLKLRDDLEAVLVLLRLAKEVKAFKRFQV